ncbi:kinase-like protein, partial [Dendrothele bispora CBS 962.96]
LSNEVLLWKQLCHRRILPLYGVSVELFQPSYCIISPWMQNGDIGSFLRKSNESRFQKKLYLVSCIHLGLSYLHGLDPPIVHGDIKGSNVLISDDFHCCLADFGLSVIETQTQSNNNSSSAHIRGSIRWLAPELMNPDTVPTGTGYSKTRDIYAFGCTVVEVLTGRPPFPEYKMDLHVMIQVLKGNRPPRPWQCSEELWALIQQCWSERIIDRPLAGVVFDRLTSLAPSPPTPPYSAGIQCSEGLFNSCLFDFQSDFIDLPCAKYSGLDDLSLSFDLSVRHSDGSAISGITWDEADLLNAWKEYQLRQSLN